jgi:hypothetical protein
MSLEGTLDTFSLPDIFQLLSQTKKSGTLHLRREGAHGAVHLRSGAVTGGRADVTCQELGRRLLGAGLVDDEALAAAADDLATDPSLSLAQLLAERGELDIETVRDLAAEQAQDAVFSLLRWTDGEFAFVTGEPDPDDLGAELSVDSLVAEGQRRITAWSELVESVPAPDVVVVVNAAPGSDPAASRAEWALLALVDGRRTVAELVALSGRGEFAVVTALAGLVGRGLLGVHQAAAEEWLVRRQNLLAALEGRSPEPPVVPAGPVGSADPAAALPAPPEPPRPVPAASAPVLPARPEPFTPPRRPDHAEAPAYARALGGQSTLSAAQSGNRGSAIHGSVHGATALAPESAVDPSAAPIIERDPSVNKSLLLRLIAGVRGL